MSRISLLIPYIYRRLEHVSPARSKRADELRLDAQMQTPIDHRGARQHEGMPNDVIKVLVAHERRHAKGIEQAATHEEFDGEWRHDSAVHKRAKARTSRLRRQLRAAAQGLARWHVHRTEAALGSNVDLWAAHTAYP